MAQIIAASDITFDINTDCVVVGAGACGLTAALRLANAGIESLVLERDVVASGSTSMSSGFIPAAGTRAQQKQSIEDSAVLFAADIQNKAHDEANPHIVKAVTEQMGAALDWLGDTHGIQWVVLDDFLYPGHSTYRMHSVPEKTGAALHNTLMSACSNSGVDVVTQAHVDALIVEYRSTGAAGDHAAVCGVRVARPDGQIEHIGSKTIILACNGYGANAELMQRFIPQMANAHYHGHAGNTGDAVLWGEQLNVPLVHTAAYQGHGSLAAGHNILITWALMMEGGIQINKDARRFSNEHAGYSEQAEKVMQQPGNIAWNIYDERLHQLGMDFPDYRKPLLLVQLYLLTISQHWHVPYPLIKTCCILPCITWLHWRQAIVRMNSVASLMHYIH